MGNKREPLGNTKVVYKCSSGAYQLLYAVHITATVLTTQKPLKITIVKRRGSEMAHWVRVRAAQA